MSTQTPSTSRRQFLTVAGASTAAALFSTQHSRAEDLNNDSGSGAPSGVHAAMNLLRSDTAVVFINPENHVLSEHGLAWAAVRESLEENHTIDDMERISKAAKDRSFEGFISPHYFFPVDKGWKFNGPLETDEAETDMFARKGRLTLDGFKGSGADWLDRFAPYIEPGKTIVVSQHRVWGLQTHDLVSGRSAADLSILAQTLPASRVLQWWSKLTVVFDMKRLI